jgi:1-phosphofructokinase family hexose kinase
MLIVTPNPAVDHTVRVEALRPGEVIRTGPGVSVAGGKGGNVTRAARQLGTRASVLAFLPEVGAAHLQSLYAAEDFELIGVPVAGRVRTCTAMIEADGRVTLLNEPGAAVTEADWARLMAALRVRADGERLIICSGSLPPGAPLDGYARIVREGHVYGCEVIVDASGEALVHALRDGADLVCPNVSEAEAAIASVAGSGGGAGSRAEPVYDDGDDVPDRAAAAAAGLLELGAGWAVVTAGAAGAAVAGPGHRAWLPSPAVTVRNPIGAGDSFLAGVATARLAGSGWPVAVRRGLASGSASVEQDGAGVVDPARVDELERIIAG